MLSLAIVLVGVAIVIVGVLVFRLHAFLALILAAIVVGALTPPQAIERHESRKRAVRILAVLDEDSQDVHLRLALTSKSGARPGMRYLIQRADADGALKTIALAEIERFERFAPEGRAERETASARVISTAVERGNLDDVESQQNTPAPPPSIEPGDVVIHPLASRAARNASEETVGERVASAFGRTCASIGILIAMAAIIGKCLLDSGAADRIVRFAMRIFGEPGAPLAFLTSGFLLGIPVFFDTVFYLMIPLGKALRLRTGRHYLLYVLTIVAGASMAHSLVPPTPGPLFVAGQLGVDLGVMILAGCAVGLFTSASGYLFAVLANRRYDLPLRESPDFSLSDLAALSQRPTRELPPLWLSLSPIVLPVVLIAASTVLKSFAVTLPVAFQSTVDVLGNKNIALILAAAIALAMLLWQKRSSLKELSGSVQAALASGGVIILITAGGGAFGGALQQTSVAELIEKMPQGASLLLIVLAFLVTTIVRTAQGSATVAMITAVGILSGLAESGQLGFHPVYLALAIGCGSKPIAWMNDSGFWVICKMSGMTEAEGLRFISPMSVVMGVVGLIVTLIGAAVFPLV